MAKLSVKKRGANAPLALSSVEISDEDWNQYRPVVLELLRIMLREKLESLSAPQVGYNIRAFVTYVKGDWIRVFINPDVEILDYDQSLIEESCASYPRKNAQRWRHRALVVHALNLKNERFIIDTSAEMYHRVAFRLAAVIQHEMEHLAGIDVRQEPLPEMDWDVEISQSSDLAVRALQEY